MTDQSGGLVPAAAPVSVPTSLISRVVWAEATATPPGSRLVGPASRRRPGQEVEQEVSLRCPQCPLHRFFQRWE